MAEFDWNSAVPTKEAEFDWDSAQPTAEASPGATTTPPGPDGKLAMDRLDSAWNKAVAATKTNLMSMKAVGPMSVEEIEKTGIWGAQMYGEAYRRPLAALTALAVETPFADPEKNPVKTFVDGLKDPEQYPPEAMAGALVDAGMDPVSAASLATLGQFGYYMGMGQGIARLVEAGKTSALVKTLNNVEKNLRAEGVSKFPGKIRAPQEIAKDTPALDVVDVYMRSKGLKRLPRQLTGPGEVAFKEGTRMVNPDTVFLPKAPEVAPPKTFVVGKDGQPITLGEPASVEQAAAALKEAPAQIEQVGLGAIITPAETVLKRLGLDEYIGSPLRQALQDTRIELAEKLTFLTETKKQHVQQVDKKELAKSTEKIWQYMDKGIPINVTGPEVEVAKSFRKETKEMLQRMNEVNKFAGLPEVKEIKDYIFHMVQPEVISEMIATGQIPDGLQKLIKPGVTSQIFLKTAQERKGLPEELLVKDPYEAMRAMYAIDLKYINLQRALTETMPYLKGMKQLAASGEKWDATSVKYVEDWINHGVKRLPTTVDMRAQAGLDRLVDFVFGLVPGQRAHNLSFQKLTGTLSAAMQTGALGLRVKVALRNLLQSSFDWVLYGTKPYLKGQKAYASAEGRAPLAKSRVWKTRMPFEAQDLNKLSAFMKKGSVLYRKADLRNVGVGLLTRYHHAKDTLGMSDQAAMEWADTDLPRSQWSYTREDLPEIYWSATGRTLATFGSWWMNFYTNFMPELVGRAFSGKASDGRTVTPQERMGILRFLVLLGVTEGIRRTTKELTGTAVDYTGVAAPTPFGASPQAQILMGAAELAQGVLDQDDRKWKEGLRRIARSGQLAIPYWLGIKDLTQLFTGKKDVVDVLFYTEPKKGRTFGRV